jgi:hypothetical protein
MVDGKNHQGKRRAIVDGKSPPRRRAMADGKNHLRIDLLLCWLIHNTFMLLKCEIFSSFT